MVAVGDDFMATVRAMDMVRQLHNRAALVQVKRVGDQGSMLVRPAIQVAFHNVPCALHTNLIYIWVVPLSPHPSLHCFSWTSLVHTRSMHVAIISSTLQLRLGRCQEWKAVELPSVDKNRGASWKPLRTYMTAVIYNSMRASCSTATFRRHSALLDASKQSKIHPDQSPVATQGHPLVYCSRHLKIPRETWKRA